MGMKAVLSALLLIFLSTSLYGSITLYFGYTAQNSYPSGQNDPLGFAGAHFDYTFVIDQPSYNINGWNETTATLSLAEVTITGSREGGIDGNYTIVDKSAEPLTLFYNNTSHDPMYEVISSEAILQNIDSNPFGSAIWLNFFCMKPQGTSDPIPGDRIKVEDFAINDFAITLAYTLDGQWYELDVIEGTKTFSAVPEIRQWAVWLGMGILPVVIYTVERREKKKATGKNAA